MALLVQWRSSSHSPSSKSGTALRMCMENRRPSQTISHLGKYIKNCYGTYLIQKTLGSHQITKITDFLLLSGMRPAGSWSVVSDAHIQASTLFMVLELSRSRSVAPECTCPSTRTKTCADTFKITVGCPRCTYPSIRTKICICVELLRPRGKKLARAQKTSRVATQNCVHHCEAITFCQRVLRVLVTILADTHERRELKQQPQSTKKRSAQRPKCSKKFQRQSNVEETFEKKTSHNAQKVSSWSYEVKALRGLMCGTILRIAQEIWVSAQAVGDAVHCRPSFEVR